MRILVMGAGALGSAVGGFMAKAGHEVFLIGRKEHMEAIEARGLRITGIWGDHLVKNLQTATSPSPSAFGMPDVVLITVKSYDTEEAVRQVLPCLGGESLVCSYQNGLGNGEIIAKYVGWERTLGARVIFGVRLLAPGAVKITVIAEPTALGVFGPEGPKERAKVLAQQMDRAGIPTRFHENILPLIWSKVAYNAALNPLSAILDVPYGRLLDSEDTKALMINVVKELYEVAKAKGVSLQPPTYQQYVDRLFGELIPSTAAHYASMREDLRRGKRTEIDALNGAICRIGKELGLNCPFNEALTRVIRSMEALSGALEEKNS